MQIRPLEERFWEKVALSDGCWEWTAARGRKGYGVIAITRTRKRYAHRIAYEMVYGPIPARMQLDHLCSNPPCIRPDHLEPVTPRENIMRGCSPTAINARKTQCPRGHEYAPPELWIDKEGKRHCLACYRVRRRERREAALLGREVLA